MTLSVRVETAIIGGRLLLIAIFGEVCYRFSMQHMYKELCSQNRSYDMLVFVGRKGKTLTRRWLDVGIYFFGFGQFFSLESVGLEKKSICCLIVAAVRMDFHPMLFCHRQCKETKNIRAQLADMRI
ncbi:unnamed protein product [Ectocarpus sp. 13 AM-2016]